MVPRYGADNTLLAEEAGRYLGVFVAPRADMWPAMVTIPLDPIFIGHRVKRPLSKALSIRPVICLASSSVVILFIAYPLILSIILINFKTPYKNID